MIISAFMCLVSDFIEFSGSMYYFDVAHMMLLPFPNTVTNGLDTVQAGITAN